MDVKSEIVEGERDLVLFETEIQGLAAEGVNVVEAGGGKVREITVYFRPLPALQRIAEVIGARMAERFGDCPPTRDRPGQEAAAVCGPSRPARQRST